MAPTPYNVPQTVAHVIANTRAAMPKGQNTLRDFGQALGVSHQQISNYESGEQEPPAETLSKWLHSRHDWISEMAIEIMVCKYRVLLQIVTTHATVAA